ncbi:hypothetical protein [Vallitalea okinawensis]|uniref:hypothetical protein n=1 Tax=Vallitalea okinawensis TaxID=2078660 RepID=UPI000CFC9B4D|nr:hypothetical protein [Vallitalea okinawensis]
MPIRPLDMQVMIPKSSQISKQSHQESHKFNQEQFNLSMAQNKQNEKNQQKVIAQDESNGVKFNKEQEKRNREQKQGKQQKNKKEQSKKKDSGYSLGHFDVKV